MTDEAIDGQTLETETVEDGPAGEIERLKAENVALKEQALRFAADAENTRRRAERESNDARAYAIQKFARDLLDAADNLARAVEHAPRDVDDSAVQTLVLGVEMTERALQTAFERNGLKRVRPERGERFDPNRHQAMLEQAADGVAPGSVVQVMQSGYELLGRLVRPAMVIVTPKGPGAAAPGDGPYGARSVETGAAIDEKA
jgi:molecular chaperone GrpE